MKKRIVLGILAHVDAGKTTLSEGLLFSAGAINRLGRVDKRDAYLDTYSLERERGITIFSKQAVFSYLDTEITLIDTPGHIDFSCEAERALSVQDYAILVISAPDGVQAHTKTLWQLLRKRNIPTFIFVNKTDIYDGTHRELMDDIRKNLSDRCADFSFESARFEEAAGADEKLMAQYFDTGAIEDSSISEAIARERLFPCFFGSALKMTGVSEFLSIIAKYTEKISYPEKLFGARVYKIGRDTQGKRLTYMKITGGKLCAKDTLTLSHDGSVFQEKVEEIRIYSADKYKSVKEAESGCVCAVLGLNESKVGMGIGFERTDEHTLEPVLDYKMILPSGASVYEVYLKLLTLTEEAPSLALSYSERAKEIRVRLMGEIQIEVLKRMIKERFDLDVSFGEGAILYKETVAESVIGSGHFEPLRHYAEVHLMIEPLERGAGIVAASELSCDLLSQNWQRLILTHIEEKVHRGVLTGSPLTDVKITLVAGKAHIKHTEGGDFRQATYRAVRQGLMKAKSVLLEPTFNFRIELPIGSLGRLMNDLANMHASADAPEISAQTATVTGICPVATMRSYATELRAYTRGEGKITLSAGEYSPCHNSEEVIEKIAYSALLDERNTPNSVFCKAGAGYVVPWDEADALMHISHDEGTEDAVLTGKAYKPTKVSYGGSAEEDKELMRIFEATYGKIKERRVSERKENSAPSDTKQIKPKKQTPKGEDYILIDGYNFIFANELLRNLAQKEISLARDTLTRLMCDYAAFKRCKILIVFDAYRRKGGEGSVEKCGDVTVIYTKEAQTADAYIEKTTHDIAATHRVRVVTSDMQEQLVVLGSGGLRVSAAEFSAEIALTQNEIKEAIDSLG